MILSISIYLCVDVRNLAGFGLSAFIHYTTISVTFHINSLMQYYQSNCLEVCIVILVRLLPPLYDAQFLTSSSTVPFITFVNHNLLTRELGNFYDQIPPVFFRGPLRIFYLWPNFLLLFWQNNQFHDSLDLIALL